MLQMHFNNKIKSNLRIYFNFPMPHLRVFFTTTKLTFQIMNLNNSCWRFSVIFVSPLGSGKKWTLKDSFPATHIQTEHA